MADPAVDYINVTVEWMQRLRPAQRRHQGMRGSAGEAHPADGSAHWAAGRSARGTALEGEGLERRLSPGSRPATDFDAIVCHTALLPTPRRSAYWLPLTVTDSYIVRRPFPVLRQGGERNDRTGCTALISGVCGRALWVLRGFWGAPPFPRALLVQPALTRCQKLPRWPGVCEATGHLARGVGVGGGVPHLRPPGPAHLLWVFGRLGLAASFAPSGVLQGMSDITERAARGRGGLM